MLNETRSWFALIELNSRYVSLEQHLLQVYPDENHFLNGGNTKIHSYNTMEDFILHCYGKAINLDELNADMSEKDTDEDDE